MVGHLQDWVFCPRNLCLIIFLALITTHSRFMPEGRSISKLNENAQIGVNREKVLFTERMMIGSRPPRCEGRCSSSSRGCGHCEAVQVPIAPPRLLKSSTKQSSPHTTKFFYGTPKSIAYSRGDDISNYKPMCWMCKCGDFIFNP